jgi:adenylate cyclase
MRNIDEAGAGFDVTRHRRQLIEPTIVTNGGRVVCFSSDGLLAEFPSALSAVFCAIAIQRGCLAHGKQADGEIMFRIGINVGDIVVDEEDLSSDEVTIATALEALSEAGAICLSRAVFDSVQKHFQTKFDELGYQQVQSMAGPIQVYSLSTRAIATLSGSPPLPTPIPKSGHLVATPAGVVRRLSIAVMPFINLSADAAQDYFADGVVEDIITALSGFRDLFVIARNSCFAFKHRDVEPREVAEKLGVRYLVEGSIRRDNSRVRITAKLIEAFSSATIWAGQFDREMIDIIDLQDQLARQIVTAIEPRLRAAEIERARRKPAASLDAYDYYLRALQFRESLSAEGVEEALQLLSQALALDPNYAPALALTSIYYAAKYDQGRSNPAEIRKAIRLARAAIEQDIDDPIALCLGGHVLAGLGGDLTGGLAYIERALRINPSYAEAWARSAIVRLQLNDPNKVIEHANRAIELNPIDPLVYLPLCAKGYADLFCGRFEQAAASARRALEGKRRPEMAYPILVAASDHLNWIDQMRDAAHKLRAHFPEFRINTWQARMLATESHRQMIAESLRKAGLPD